MSQTLTKKWLGAPDQAESPCGFATEVGESPATPLLQGQIDDEEKEDDKEEESDPDEEEDDDVPFIGEEDLPVDEEFDEEDFDDDFDDDFEEILDEEEQADDDDDESVPGGDFDA